MDECFARQTILLCNSNIMHEMEVEKGKLKKYVLIAVVVLVI